MFKKEIPPSARTKLKSSHLRQLKATLTTTYPLLKPYEDAIFPVKSKKSSSSVESMKISSVTTKHRPEGCNVVVYLLDGQPLVFGIDSPKPGGGKAGSPGEMLLPHLKLVHRYPECFPSMRVDTGAIRYILDGAVLMAPGLTSKGGRLPEPREIDTEAGETDGRDEEGRWSRELEKTEPVVIMAEGKEHACAVGVLVAGTKEVKAKGKGPVMEDAHCLGDSLWKLNLG